MRKLIAPLLWFTSMYLNAQPAEDFYVLGNMLVEEGNYEDALKYSNKIFDLECELFRKSDNDQEILLLQSILKLLNIK